jgi:hypothetical protein
LRSSRLLPLVAAALITGCGDDDGPGGTDSDAAPVCAPLTDDDECFPIEASHPEGTVEIGTGIDEWRPMEEEERTTYGIQGGFHFDVHARMSGLAPGNPSNVLDDCNPKTRFRAFFEDGTHINSGGECPIRVGYAQEDGGDYVLSRPLAVLFDTCLVGDDIFGRRYRIVVEVIDSEGRYATDETMVTALPPGGWPDAGPPPDAGAGEMDAGPSDAGEGRDCPYPPRP